VGTVTSNQIILKSVAGAAPSGALGGAPQVMVVQDQKPDGTAGGTNVVGLQTRTLNTVQYNSITGASLSSNTVTLPAGTYRIHANVPGFAVNWHQARLYDVTGSAVLITGTGKYSDSTAINDNDSVIDGVITLSGTTQIRVEHNMGVVKTTQGLGPHTSPSWGIEVYTTMTIEKLQ